MKVLNSVLKEIHAVRPCSKGHLRRLLLQFDVQPIGKRQRPQLYPDDTAARILAGLGLAPHPTNGTNGNGHAAAGRLPTLTQLKAERTKARRTK